jgi:hypothetical protein
MVARRSRSGRRARYRVRDWAAYDRALARRGDIMVSVSPDAVAGWRAPAGRRTFSDAAIEAVLMVRAAFRLALRQAEGLIASIVGVLGVALPDHTILSRRGGTLHLRPRPHASGRLDLALDNSGLHVAQPRGTGCRGRRKLHIAVDPGSGSILDEELTRSDVHDSMPVPAMLSRIEAACCTGRRSGCIEPYPCSGSCQADVLRASEVQHAVQHVGGDRHLGRLTPVRL